jgi:hypothetical protein
MNRCPTCQKEAVIGELFCCDCGGQLQNSGVKTLTPPLPAQDKSSTLPIAEHLLEQKEQKSVSVSLKVLGSTHTISLSDREAFTLGRDVEGQALHPDIDLSVFQGYEMGVSRMHLILRIDSQITATDLGSSNGTRLNDVKMNPNKAYHLNNGDIVSLGKLKIQVIISQNERE